MVDEPATDEALLLAARTDAQAFTQFYRRHAAMVLGYLVRRTRDPELGRDRLPAGHAGLRSRPRAGRLTWSRPAAPPRCSRQAIAKRRRPASSRPSSPATVEEVTRAAAR
jgi:hypothetical protein